MSIEEKPKAFTEMITKRNEIESYLKKLDAIIHDNETKYLENTALTGNIFKGWDQIFTCKSKIPHSAVCGGKRFRISQSERFFSQASVNNPYLKDDNLSNASHSFHNGMNNQLQRNMGSPHRHKKKITQSLSVKKKKTSTGKKEVDLDPDSDYV